MFTLNNFLQCTMWCYLLFNVPTYEYQNRNRKKWNKFYAVFSPNNSIAGFLKCSPVLAPPLLARTLFTPFPRLPARQCFTIWDLDVRGHHHGMWRFHYYDNTVLLFAVPINMYM